MNNLQKTVSSISGLTLEDGSLRNNARDDFYYDCETNTQKKEQIEAYAENCLNIYLNESEIAKVIDCLDFLENESNESSEAFTKLNNLQ